MPPEGQQIVNMLSSLLQYIEIPFWRKIEFWIFLVIGGMGVVFSLLAFIEAKKAKRAATVAGRTVKIQTITIDLTEVSQKLDKLRIEIPYNEARDLLTEISRRLRRIISPFQGESDLKETLSELKTALGAAKESLNAVRPIDPSHEDASNAVYYAVESDFATINNCVADLLGLFEKKL